MSNPDTPSQLPLTDEQKELIHQLTGEHAVMLELTTDPSNPKSGLQFNWRVPTDSETPKEQKS